jgi:Fic family protein
MNERQIKLLNKLPDEFDGNITTSKWAVIAKCSQDTSLCNNNELLERGVLMRSEASGGSTSYELQSAMVDAFGKIKQGLNCPPRPIL